MKQSRTKLAQTIAVTTLAKGNTKAFSKQIAAYLISERRVSELNSVLRDIQADWAEAGHVEVIATTAFPLTADVKSNITKEAKKLYPAATKIIVTEVHDESVIGGVQLSLANQSLDMSIESKLNKFKQLTLTGKER